MSRSFRSALIIYQVSYCHVFLFNLYILIHVLINTFKHTFFLAMRPMNVFIYYMYGYVCIKNLIIIMYIVLFHPFNRFYIHFPRSREHEILVSLSIMGILKKKIKNLLWTNVQVTWLFSNMRYRKRSLRSL